MIFSSSCVNQHKFFEIFFIHEDFIEISYQLNLDLSHFLEDSFTIS